MITSRRVSLISSSRPVKYVTPSPGKATAADSVPAGVRVALGWFSADPILRATPCWDETGSAAHANTTPLYSFNTDGGEAKSGERWSLAVSLPPSLSSANGTQSFQGVLVAFENLVLLLFFTSQIDIVLMKFVPRSFLCFIVKATCCQFVCVQTCSSVSRSHTSHEGINSSMRKM